jgi:hypothetical protein
LPRPAAAPHRRRPDRSFCSIGVLIWQHLDEWEIGKINVIPQAHVWLGGLLRSSCHRLAVGRRGAFPSPSSANGAAPGLALCLLLSAGGYPQRPGVVRPRIRRHEQARARCAMCTLGAALVWRSSSFTWAVLLAPANRGLLAGMLTGRVGRETALRASPDWVASLDRQAAENTPTSASPS